MWDKIRTDKNCAVSIRRACLLVHPPPSCTAPRTAHRPCPPGACACLHRSSERFRRLATAHRGTNHTPTNHTPLSRDEPRGDAVPRPPARDRARASRLRSHASMLISFTLLVADAIGKSYELVQARSLHQHHQPEPDHAPSSHTHARAWSNVAAHKHAMQAAAPRELPLPHASLRAAPRFAPRAHAHVCAGQFRHVVRGRRRIVPAAAPAA